MTWYNILQGFNYCGGSNSNTPKTTVSSPKKLTMQQHLGQVNPLNGSFVKKKFLLKAQHFMIKTT